MFQKDIFVHLAIRANLLLVGPYNPTLETLCGLIIQVVPLSLAFAEVALIQLKQPFRHNLLILISINYDFALFILPILPNKF